MLRLERRATQALAAQYNSPWSAPYAATEPWRLLSSRPRCRTTKRNNYESHRLSPCENMHWPPSVTSRVGRCWCKLSQVKRSAQWLTGCRTAELAPWGERVGGAVQVLLAQAPAAHCPCFSDVSIRPRPIARSSSPSFFFALHLSPPDGSLTNSQQASSRRTPFSSRRLARDLISALTLDTDAHRATDRKRPTRSQ